MSVVTRWVDYTVKDEGEKIWQSIVQIGDAYTEDGGERYGDDSIMFYFADEAEFMSATKEKSVFDFVIVSWEDFEEEE
jgi:hypothetical protein